MSENKSRREFISQSGKMVTACALFGATGSVAYAADSAKPTCETGKPMTITAKHYYLDNVLLEAGFNFDGNVATSTRTELKTLEIQDGKIVALRDNKRHDDATLPHYDAGNTLMLRQCATCTSTWIKPSTAARGVPSTARRAPPFRI